MLHDNVLIWYRRFAESLKYVGPVIDFDITCASMTVFCEKNMKTLIK